MLRIVAEALPVYERWFGPYPVSRFHRRRVVFRLERQPVRRARDDRRAHFRHAAPRRQFVDELVSHEFCHQWWYNVVGVNGYAETWMDEGLAIYFAHRLMDLKYGKNNTLVSLPTGLDWLPNIHRDDYRYTTMIGSLARGEATPDRPGRCPNSRTSSA